MLHIISFILIGAFGWLMFAFGACSLLGRFIRRNDVDGRPCGKVLSWRKVAVLALTAFIVAGCRAQVPTSPPVYSCPVPTSTLWTPLNPVGSSTNPPVAVTNYKDNLPSPSNYCYGALSYRASDGQYSVLSNTSLATVTAGKSTFLTWTAPLETNLLYVIVRAPATLVTPPVAPTLNAPSTALLATPPVFPIVVSSQPSLAFAVPFDLRSVVR